MMPWREITYSAGLKADAIWGSTAVATGGGILVAFEDMTWAAFIFFLLAAFIFLGRGVRIWIENCQIYRRGTRARRRAERRGEGSGAAPKK